MSYMAKLVMVTEDRTKADLTNRITQPARKARKERESMSRYQYLAHLTEIAPELSGRTRISVDSVFKQLSSQPRSRVHLEAVRIVEETVINSRSLAIMIL
jgi:hypothetical protein